MQDELDAIQQERIPKRFYYLAGIGIFILVILILFFVQASKRDQINNPSIDNNESSLTSMQIQNGQSGSPEPTIYEQSDQYKKEQSKIDLTISPMQYQTDKAGELLDIVPYQGKYFLLEYDNNKLNFVVTINKENENDGNTEFDAFLKNKGVLSRTWLHNLKVLVK